MVRFGSQKAFLRRGEWFSANAGLESQLNDITTSWIQETGGPPLDDHDHERTVAETIAGLMGGRVVRRVRPSAKLTAQIYIARRQMDLPFV